MPGVSDRDGCVLPAERDAMSYAAGNRSQSAPEFWHEPKEHSRKIVQALNGVLNGQTNNTFQVTLEAGATSTSVSFVPALTLLRKNSSL